MAERQSSKTLKQRAADCAKSPLNRTRKSVVTSQARWLMRRIGRPLKPERKRKGVLLQSTELSHRMPRYYFDIRDSSGFYADEEGLELPDVKAAQIEAAASLAGMVRNAAPRMERERMAIEVRTDEESLFEVTITLDVNRLDG